MKSVTLRRQVRDATVEVLEGLTQLLDVIISTPLESLSQDQLTSTGTVWSACERFDSLPKDNKAALLVVLSGELGVIKDAIEEIEEQSPYTGLSVSGQQTQTDLELNWRQCAVRSPGPVADVLDDVIEGAGPRGNQDTYWSEQDRRVIGPCQGLMKASAACLRKLTSAVRTHADGSCSHNLAQLDDLADSSRDISPVIREKERKRRESERRETEKRESKRGREREERERNRESEREKKREREKEQESETREIEKRKREERKEKKGERKSERREKKRRGREKEERRERSKRERVQERGDVDDLALCLYPPMDYSGVETNASKLASVLKKTLHIIRSFQCSLLPPAGACWDTPLCTTQQSSHVCGEAELTWVQFLDNAVEHNLQKAKDLMHQDT
ncbi:hypothetical protein WMY93_011431 [Mugilogobius chulae]|uniref:Cyclin-D1-binding protein 1 n=1 Tax=Mugilogobius chulae TaxID=88201 RepID=A0AAW0P2U2_9GOBI